MAKQGDQEAEAGTTGDISLARGATNLAPPSPASEEARVGSASGIGLGLGLGSWLGLGLGFKGGLAERARASVRLAITGVPPLVAIPMLAARGGGCDDLEVNYLLIGRR